MDYKYHAPKWFVLAIYRLSNAQIRATPYRDGTTHVFFQPLDFIARLAALVPKPRVNLTGTMACSHLTVSIVHLLRPRIGVKVGIDKKSWQHKRKQALQKSGE